MTPLPITVVGAEQLKTELHKLRTVDRPNVIQAISDARAQGDLSENAEYESAKERQSFIEGRIAELESKISNAMVIDPTTLQADGRCVFGATVHIEDVSSGKAMIYQIVGEDESNIQLGKISIKSPLARALIGKVAGEVVEVEAPGGSKEYEVLVVEYR